ncbi:MAG: AbrB/MazE/SpoVT family DNA-binding domain-containing protein [Deltaproteobacteria bacterium]|nr:AbrB/MazE/SpoVT family DNA-binding domain-containing protein [Deltaproteobacteria bacterium]
MPVRIARWGNSLALRLPKTIAEQAGLRDGSVVDLLVEGGNVLIRTSRCEFKLEELVRKMRKANAHAETDWGAAEGDETW